MNKQLTSAHWTRDPLFYLFMGLGSTALLLPSPSSVPVIWALALMALAEEIIFRYLLQDWLKTFYAGRRQLGLITVANLIASILFAAAHMFYQPVIWAMGAFFPSVIFGIIWDRHSSITACFCLHFFYNICFFYL